MFVKDTKYSYVDLFYQGIKEWQRITFEEATNLTDGSCTKKDVYTTLNAWENPEKSEGEMSITPLYWDLDSDNLDLALEETVRLCEFLKDLLQLEDISKSVMVHFTGKKGFHVIVDHRVTGTLPMLDCHKVVKRACLGVRDLLDLKTVDNRVYSKRRGFRLPNTKHSGSGLYCIEIDHDELTLPMDDIKELAATPREERIFEHKLGVKPTGNPFWAKAVREHRDLQQFQQMKPVKPLGDLKGKLPICVKTLLEEGLSTPSTRNDALLVLVPFFKTQGFSKDETLERVIDWSLTRTGRYSRSSDEQKKAEARGTVDWAYEKDGDAWANDTFFACSKVQSIGMPCIGEACEFVNPGDQDQEKPVTCSIMEASTAKMAGKRMEMEAFVYHKHDRSYTTPKQVTMTCEPGDRSSCRQCPHAKKCGDNGQVVSSLTIDASHDAVVDLIKDNKAKERTVFRSLLRIPAKCKEWSWQTTGYTDVFIIKAQPIFKPGEAVEHNDSYMEASCYILAPYGEIKEMEAYKLEGVMHPSPKGYHSVFIIDNYEPISESFLNWIPDDPTIKRLKKFQPEVWTKESILQKMDDIAKDQEEAVHYIRNRRTYSTLIDMVWHSPLYLKVPGKGGRATLGRIEMLVLGDSGHGKSEMVKQKMAYYESGTRITAETMTRTGLLGGNVKDPDGGFIMSWGVGPQCDGRLLVIDEVHDEGLATKEALRKLTNARSDGIAQINSAKSGQHNMRVRMIWIGNPPHNKKTSVYSYPVMMATELFKEMEDIRRFDHMVSLRDDDVTSRDINTAVIEKAPYYSSADCRDRVLWAWSRDKDQIEFEEGSEELIGEWAERMYNDYHQSIPLVSTGDMNIKIAKAAASLAACTFSTEDGYKCLVTKAHIDAAMQIYDDNYRSESLGYFEYSKLKKRMDVFENTDELTNIVLELGNVHLTTAFSRQTTMDFLASAPLFDINELETRCSLSENQARGLFKFMGRNRLVTKEGRFSWGMTPRGKTFVEHIRNNNLPSLAEKAADEMLGEW